MNLVGQSGNQLKLTIPGNNKKAVFNSRTGTYTTILQTNDLTPGNYTLNFKVGNDTKPYSVRLPDPIDG